MSTMKDVCATNSNRKLQTWLCLGGNRCNVQIENCISFDSFHFYIISVYINVFMVIAVISLA